MPATFVEFYNYDPCFPREVESRSRSGVMEIPEGTVVIKVSKVLRALGVEHPESIRVCRFSHDAADFDGDENLAKGVYGFIVDRTSPGNDVPCFEGPDGQPHLAIISPKVKAGDSFVPRKAIYLHRAADKFDIRESTTLLAEMEATRPPMLLGSPRADNQGSCAFQERECA